MKRYCLLLLIAASFIGCGSLAAETLKEHVALLLKDAPDPGKDGLTKKVPGKVVDAKLGFFGLFALLKFEDQCRLGILNIAQGKFQKMLNMKSTNFQYAAGSSLLFIFYPDIKVIELWDLQTMKKIKAKKLSISDGFLTTFAMAPALKSKVLVSGAVGGEALDRRFYGILDLKTFRLTKFEKYSLFHNTSYRDRIHMRCNKNMTKVLSWCTSHTPTGFIYVSLSSKPPVSKYEHSSFGSLNFANNDNLILTTNGSILNTDGKLLKNYSQSMLFPVLGDDFYVQYKQNSKEGDPNLIVRDLNSHMEVTALTTDVKLERTSWAKTAFTSDRGLLASKISDRMVIIDNKNLKLKIYALGISGKGNSFGSVPKAFVGKKWTCKLNYPKGTKVVIEDGPENITFDAASNMLIWDKPTTHGIQDLLLSITKPGEEEFYKDIKIIVKEK